MVTSRVPQDGLAIALAGADGIKATVIGDALCPGPVVTAVYSGHLAARRHGEDGEDPAIFRRE